MCICRPARKPVPDIGTSERDTCLLQVHQSLIVRSRQHQPHPSEQTAVFIARFKFARLSQRCNRILSLILSLIPIPLIVGFPGFQEKIWMVDEETGYWQGIYQWESESAIVAHQQSYVLRVMNKRAVSTSISYTFLPNTRLSDFIKNRLVKNKTS